ncbi:MAG: hypothetical protein V7L25_06280 [Nostoc sp.]
MKRSWKSLLLACNWVLLVVDEVLRCLRRAGTPSLKHLSISMA